VGRGYDAGALDTDADVGPPGANEIIVRAVPLHVELEVVGDVQPLDDDLAGELGRVRGAPDEHAHLVRMTAVDHGAGRERWCREALGGALDEELLFDVAAVGGNARRRE